jgi:hypothetical protein
MLGECLGNCNDKTVAIEAKEVSNGDMQILCRQSAVIESQGQSKRGSNSRANVKANSETSSSKVVGGFSWAKARWRHAAGYSAIDNASITAFPIHEVTTDGDGAGAPSQESLRGEALTLIFISIGDLPRTSFHLSHTIPIIPFNNLNNTIKMGYPEHGTGFMVNDQKNWTKFEKKEVPWLSFQPSLGTTNMHSVQTEAIR